MSRPRGRTGANDKLLKWLEEKGDDGDDDMDEQMRLLEAELGMVDDAEGATPPPQEADLEAEMAEQMRLLEEELNLMDASSNDDHDEEDRHDQRSSEYDDAAPAPPGRSISSDDDEDISDDDDDEGPPPTLPPAPEYDDSSSSSSSLDEPPPVQPRKQAASEKKATQMAKPKQVQQPRSKKKAPVKKQQPRRQHAQVADAQLASRLARVECPRCGSESKVGYKVCTTCGLKNPELQTDEERKRTEEKLRNLQAQAKVKKITAKPTEKKKKQQPVQKRQPHTAPKHTKFAQQADAGLAAKLKRIACARCGTENRSGYKSCGSCGLKNPN